MATEEPVVESDTLKLTDSDEEEDAYVQFNIATYPSDFTLSVLYDKWKSSEIVIPTFQRGYVWKIEQASKLIESFLLGLPVPSLFFYIDESRKSLVIDGHQRLKSVFYFFEGYFGEEDPKTQKRLRFRLKGLTPKSPFYNRDYAELNETDQIAFRDSVLRAINVRQLMPSSDDSSIYYIFERLNTGGVRLRPQEIRNCLYRGSFNEMLKNVNSSNRDWRRLLGTETLSPFQRDVELLLRVLTFSDTDSTYVRPLKEFMNKYMLLHRNADEPWLAEQRIRLERSLKIAADNLGERPFHVRGPLNAAVLDSVLCAVIGNSSKPQGDLRKHYQELTKDKDYLNLVAQSTSDEASVKARFTRAAETLYLE